MTAPELTPSCGNPCQECPFRKSNAGRQHPMNLYTDDQFTSEWKLVSDGDFFACHVTAPDLHPYDEKSKEAGYVTPVETGTRPECAGAALAIQRELDRAATYPSYAAYHAAMPAGLSEKAIKRVSDRITGQASPAFRPPVKFPIDAIRDPFEEVDMDSPLWALGGETTDALVARIDALLGCSCPVCENHTEVHPGSPIKTVDGETAMVDAVLAPLLQTMNQAGIRTTDSCQDLGEAVARLWPERLPTLTLVSAGMVNYAVTIKEGSAFIRMQSANAAERRFIEAARGIGTWQIGDAAIAQLDFQLSDIAHLAALLQAVND